MARIKSEIVFVSPHLDDAVLSCGGWIAKLVESGRKVVVVTVFSGGREGGKRKEEDRKALKVLGVKGVCLDVVDAKFRTGEVSAEEIEKKIRSRVGVAGEWCFPLGLGQHVDHVILREVGERWEGRVFFYEDFPYLRFLAEQKRVVDEVCGGMKIEFVDIRPWVTKKIAAIEKYESQLVALTRYKELYVASNENYFRRSDDGELRWTVMMTDELVGGAKKVNDYLADFLAREGRRFLRYEQVAPNMGGWGVGWRLWGWRVANFWRYLMMISKLPDLALLTTSPNLLMAAFLVKLFWGRRWKRLVYYCHADRNTRPERWKSGWWSRFYWWLYGWSEKLVIGVADKVLFPSKFIKERMQTQGWQMKKIAIVSPGVEMSCVVQREGKRKTEKILLCVGRIDRIKRIEMVVEAVKKMTGVKLVVVAPKRGNDVEYWEELRQLAKGLMVEWKFLEDGEEVGDYYRVADCVVSMSEVESFSMVLVEAFAGETIFCGVESGIVGEFLSEVDRNLIIGDQNLVSVVRTISYVLALGVDERRRIIKRAAKELRKYNWTVVRKRFIEEMTND